MSRAAVSDHIEEPSVAIHPMGQRILIIDDEAGIRDSLETLLTLEGFRVDLAGDGIAGLDQLTRNTYDLLLLDLALPGYRLHELQGGQEGTWSVSVNQELAHHLPV